MSVTRAATATLCTTLLFAAALGCTTRIHTSEVQQLARYRSWAWLPANRPDDVQFDEAVRRAIEGELARRGFVEAPDYALPDVYLVYRVWTRPEAEIRRGGGPAQQFFALHSGPSYTISDHESSLRVYEKGTLAIDVVDARQGVLLWRSVDTRKTRDQYRERIPKVVGSLLSHFPSANRRAPARRADEGPGFDVETVELPVRDPGLAAR